MEDGTADENALEGSLDPRRHTDFVFRDTSDTAKNPNSKAQSKSKKLVER